MMTSFEWKDFMGGSYRRFGDHLEVYRAVDVELYLEVILKWFDITAHPENKDDPFKYTTNHQAQIRILEWSSDQTFNSVRYREHTAAQNYCPNCGVKLK